MIFNIIAKKKPKTILKHKQLSFHKNNNFSELKCT